MTAMEQASTTGTDELTHAHPQAHALSAANIMARYGKNLVLHDINLTVKSGSIFGLIGRNGVGKTTFIKTVLGLTDRPSGVIDIFGFEASTLPARLKMCFLPEQFSPSPYVTGWEFISLNLAYYHQKLDKEATLSMAERLELNPTLLKKRVTSYSKGTGQKLGLIATLLLKRPLTILDEPMSGLDPVARAHLKDCLIEAKAQGRTILLSSHILADLDEICDDVAVLHDGKIRYHGSPAGLRDLYPNATLERAFLNLIQTREAA